MAAVTYRWDWSAIRQVDHVVTGRIAVVTPDPDGATRDIVVQLEDAGLDVVVVGTTDPLPPCEHALFVSISEAGLPRTEDQVVLGVQWLVRQLTGRARPRVWWITRGGVAVGTDEVVESAQAAVWGAVPSIALEHPAFAHAIVDLDPADEGIGLVDALRTGERRVAIRSGVPHRVRLRPTGPLSAPPLDPEGAYVVTGGGGAVGRRIVAYLLEQGVGHVWALSRTAPEADEAWPERWTHIAVDLADVEAVRDALAEVRAAGRRLAGLFHAAGAQRDVLVRDSSPEAFAEAFAAKVQGAENLHPLLHDVEHVVFLSSAVGWLGLEGQAAYGAANAALDAIAASRRARGLPAVSVALGPWDVGMSAGKDFEALGMPPLDPDAAVRTLHLAMAGPPNLALLKADFGALARRYPDGPPAILTGLPGVRPTVVGANDVSSWVRTLRRTAPDSRFQWLEDQLRGLLAEVRGEELPASFTATTGFGEAGLDSLMAVELVRRISRQIDRPLPATVAFDHPDLESLVRFVLRTLDLDAATPSPAPVVALPETHDDDAVAIVGMGCRFPGADTPEALWDVLMRGDQPIVEVPLDRWDADAWYDPDVRGALDRSYVRSGGFISDIDQFDPEFFGISPREADALDPQQRVLLEVAHEALERAGHASRALRHSRTGVFVGIQDRHYLERFRRPGRPRYPDAWAGTGSDASFAAGRVAHALGLEGPAVAVNTTCSSSLVALHLARRSLLLGECDRAIAGGVSLMLLPDDTAYLCAIGALSPTERCHVFDRAADGYVRSEGCGVVVLRRLSDALAAGDPVLAVIAGSAVNHDGPSAGITVPNGAAQAAVIRLALADAGRSADDLGYVEAHGTGTPLGDPIEIHALQTVLGDRRNRPDVVVGAIKAHLGHLELAAGAASVIKAVLVLEHGEIPGQPLRELNPEIDDTGILVPTRPVPWPDDTRLAGVSGFGLSGTNAHVLLERGPRGRAVEREHREPGEAAPPSSRPVHLLALSAASETSLGAIVDTLPYDAPLPSVARAVHGRGPYPFRMAVVAADGAEAKEALARATPRRARSAPGVAFLFSGQGSQIAGAASALARTWPAFDDHLDHCASVLDPLLARPLREIVDDADALDRTEFTQPVLLAVQVGMARLLESFGIVPSVVLGHSLGELTAATVAGVFDLDDGLRLVATRGRLMAERAAEGAMLAVFASADDVRPHLPADVEIAAVNGPQEVAVAGPPAPVDQAERALERAGIQVRRLRTSRPFHTSAVDPLLDDWAAAVAAVSASEPRIDVVSLLTGRVERRRLREPDFWRRHTREPVLAHEGLQTLAQQPVSWAVDVGGRPVLAGLASRIPALEGVAVASTHGDDPVRGFVGAVAEAFAAGVDVDFEAWDQPFAIPRARVPTYPFARRRHWLAEPRRAIDDWTYGLRWVPIPAEGPLPGVVEVLGDASLVREGLREAGLTVRAAKPGKPPSASTLDLRFVEVRGLADVIESILEVWRGWPEPTPDATEPVLTYWVLTRGGGPRSREVADPESAAQASAIHSLVESLRLESRRDVRAVDVGELSEVAIALGAGEPVVAVDGDRVVGRRLERVLLPLTEPVLRPGWWWITGGLGALGRSVAEWLADRGVQRLVLTARRPLPDAETLQAEADPEARERIAGVAALRERGVDVVVEAIDAADRSAMAGLWERHPPVAVIHAAGVTLPQSAEHVQRSDVDAIVRGKAEGARVVVELAAGHPDVTLVFFSSIAATWGSKDLAAYAAANGYLDGLAARLRADGRDATSLAWGPWGSGGMIDGRRAAALDRAGVQLLAPSEALTAFGAVLGAGRAGLVVARVQWRILAPALALHGPRPLLEDVLSDSLRSTDAAVSEPAPTASPSEKPPFPGPPSGAEPEPPLRQRLREAVREVMRLDPARELSDDEPIGPLGFDSLMATELQTRLRNEGLHVPLGRVLGGPSIEELVAMVRARSTPDDSPGAPRPVASPEPSEELSVPLLFWTHLSVFVLGLAIAFGVGAWLWGP